MSTTISTPSSPLLALPLEVRARILSQLLTAAHVRRPHPTDPLSATYAFHASILRTNRQLHGEARDVLTRTNTFIRITTLWAQAEDHIAHEGHVPIIARGPHAATFAPVHVNVDIDVPGSGRPGVEFARCVMIICLADLAAFGSFWFYNDLSHPGLNTCLYLHLAVHNLLGRTRTTALPREIQAAILHPFHQVKQLKGLSVTGAIDPSVRAAFLAENALPASTPEACLDETHRLKDLGNAYIRTRHPRRALQAYLDAFRAMHILIEHRHRQVWAEPFFDKRLAAGHFVNQDGAIVRMVLRIQLVANVMAAYLELEEWDEVVFWGMRSITLVREQMGEFADTPHEGFPARASWGKIYYRTGKAQQALGRTDEARELFRLAADWLPNEPNVVQARAETALRLG